MQISLRTLIYLAAQTVMLSCLAHSSSPEGQRIKRSLSDDITAGRNVKIKQGLFSLIPHGVRPFRGPVVANATSKRGGKAEALAVSKRGGTVLSTATVGKNGTAVARSVSLGGSANPSNNTAIATSRADLGGRVSSYAESDAVEGPERKGEDDEGGETGQVFMDDVDSEFKN